MAEDEVKLEQKPLSNNKVAAFFQRIYRWWLGVWYGFKASHVKLANIIYMIFFFFVFSMGVTIWQYIVMTFLPYLFKGTWGTAFVWPQVTLWTWADGTDMIFGIFNEPIKYTIAGSAETLTATSMDIVNAAGGTVTAGGLGNFIAFEIAVFTAQCINFPLQRNITYRSHGNPWFQAMWYFIGWVAISILTNAVWGFVGPILTHWQWPDAISNIIKTFITGGLSMIIFFFIFMIIFPNADKYEKSKVAKAEKAKAKYDANPSDEKAKAAYEKAQLAATKAAETRKVYYAEGAISEANSLAETKISAYLAIKKKHEKGDGKVSEEDVNKAKQEAVDAVMARDKTVPEQNAILDEIKAARAARGENK